MEVISRAVVDMDPSLDRLAYDCIQTYGVNQFWCIWFWCCYHKEDRSRYLVKDSGPYYTDGQVVLTDFNLNP